MSRRGERIEFRPEEQACCRRLSALGVADMDHIVADGRGDVWLVEVMSKTMLGRDDVASKCARKAAHTLLMLGAAMGPLHWGDDLPVAGLGGGDPRLRLAFVAHVQAEKDLAGLGPVRDQIIRAIRPWAADFGVGDGDIDVISLEQAHSLGLPTAG